jgi:hypothetical protein
MWSNIAEIAGRRFSGALGVARPIPGNRGLALVGLFGWHGKPQRVAG